MRPVPSTISSRYLALWFPYLPAERHARRVRHVRTEAGCATPADGPMVFVERAQGGMRLAALSPAARAAGLETGLTLADARARRPDLVALDHDPAADAAFLTEIADDCDRWTPLVALDAPDGLVLDIRGCAHLFGGEAAMRTRLLAHLAAYGVSACAVVAGTPEAARALARAAAGSTGRGGVVPPGAEARYVAPLPVSALELDAATVSGLARAGLKRIGDLAARPGTPLAARFGEGLLTRLRRTLGQEDACIVPRRPLPDLVAERRFAEPVARAEDMEQALAGLLAEMGRMLEARGSGGRLFEASFFRTDGAVRRLTVDTARPARETALLARLFRERMEVLADPIDPGFGFDMMRLSVHRAEPLDPAQVDLDGRAQAQEEVAALIDRLVARLGRTRVLTLRPGDSHDPEQAEQAVPAMEAGPPHAAPAAEETLPRPLTLFHPPQPVDALAEVPDGPPLRFRWRRVLHDVALAEGPERIAPDWWRRYGIGEALPARDYYRVEDREGRRFWLFRCGLHGRDADAPRWFVHGLFP